MQQLRRTDDFLLKSSSPSRFQDPQPWDAPQDACNRCIYIICIYIYIYKILMVTIASWSTSEKMKHDQHEHLSFRCLRHISATGSHHKKDWHKKEHLRRNGQGWCAERQKKHGPLVGNQFIWVESRSHRGWSTPWTFNIAPNLP